MLIREIHVDEVSKLFHCVAALAYHHNQVSTHHKGLFPLRKPEQVIEGFAEALLKRQSLIAVLEDNNKVVGFCKVNIVKPIGKIDYLYLDELYRGKGLGRYLMDWAMAKFKATAIGTY